MPATITSAARVHSALSFIENLSLEDIFLFAGKVDPWEFEGAPDQVFNNYAELRKLKKENVFIKKTTSEDNTLGLKRYDWVADVVYTPWDDETDMMNPQEWLSTEQPFYVHVSDSTSGFLEQNVYLCIDNNFGGPSYTRPTGQTVAPIVLADGYKWKFMYSVRFDFLDFLSPGFVPCPHKDINKSDPHLLVEANSIPGTIDRIKLLNTGSNYSTISVDVVGDGSGAVISVSLSPTSGSITDYQIINPGSGYTFAEIQITGDGSNASLKPVISPSEGHGYNSAMQLGAGHVLYKGTFFTDEGGNFTPLAVYRRVGLMRNIKDQAGASLLGTRYDLSDQLEVDNIIGSFLNSQKIRGNFSGASAILYYTNAGLFNITNKQGQFVVGETIFLESDPSVLASIIEINNNIEVNIRSGDIIYYENLQPVVRRVGQSESFIFSIEF